jgi:hypothetical protein
MDSAMCLLAQRDYLQLMFCCKPIILPYPPQAQVVGDLILPLYKKDVIEFEYIPFFLKLLLFFRISILLVF